MLIFPAWLYVPRHNTHYVEGGGEGGTPQTPQPTLYPLSEVSRNLKLAQNGQIKPIYTPTSPFRG